MRNYGFPLGDDDDAATNTAKPTASDSSDEKPTK